MGLGGTTKKIQLLAERAEQLYQQVGEVLEQMKALRETVEHTGERVDDLARENEKQNALIYALAEERGIDIETVLTEAAIEDVETRGAGDGTESEGHSTVEASQEPSDDATHVDERTEPTE